MTWLASSGQYEVVVPVVLPTGGGEERRYRVEGWTVDGDPLIGVFQRLVPAGEAVKKMQADADDHAAKVGVRSNIYGVDSWFLSTVDREWITEATVPYTGAPLRISDGSYRIVGWQKVVGDLDWHPIFVDERYFEHRE